MRSVKISALKAHLSAHIRFVRSGEQVLVCERNLPVARIVPVPLQRYADHEKRLVSRGVLLPPLKKRSEPVKWPIPPGNVSEKVMRQVWRDERSR